MSKYKLNSIGLQLFSEEDGYTVDQALEVINGNSEIETKQETTEQETEPEVVTEQSEEVEEQPEKQPAEIEQEETKQEAPAIDYSMKVKFKANGQEVEKSIQDLINDAQLASNYNKHMQEMAAQRKAFETALQQQQQQPEQPKDPAEEWEKRLQEEEARNPNFNRFDPAHTLALATKIMKEEQQAEIQRQSQEAQLKEYQAQDQRYSALVEANWKDPDIEKINDFAKQSFFSLPQKGPEGLAKFQQLWPIYQKIEQRDRMWQGEKVMLDPFTAKELDEIEKFMNDAKAEFKASLQKQQVKAQVPKSVPIKPTVKVESTTTGDPAPAKKLDYKKLRSMDIDDIANLL